MLNKKGKHILIVAGEASGDLHGANLVQAIKDIDPTIFIQGIGGDLMKKAGVEILIPSTEMAVVGITEVFSKLGSIINAHFTLKKILRADRPDLIILIDYPDFNINLARSANRYSVPVLYYISPQVWAWRKGRIKKIARRVDRMAVILPFEKEVYNKTSLKVDYVGHPLLDSLPTDLNREKVLKDMAISDGRPVIGLLPGSRSDEINKLLPLMIKSVEIISEHFPKLQCILPVAPTISDAQVQPCIENSLVEIKLTRNSIYGILSVCDLVFVASGTATLETAMMNTPMVIVYKVSLFSYWIGRIVIKVPYIGLVNLVAGDGVVPELIQKDANPQRLAEEALLILNDDISRAEMTGKLKEVKNSLGMGGASKRTAEIAIEMMKT